MPSKKAKKALLLPEEVVAAPSPQEGTFQEESVVPFDLRVDKALLWEVPYDGLRFWVRWWQESHRELMRLRRYDQSNTLALLPKDVKETIRQLYQVMMTQKERSEKKVVEIVKTSVPEWEVWGKKVPGLGAFSLGKLLGLIGCPAARCYVSSLWRHCGLVPKEGRLEKGEKGQIRPYNARAKSQLWLMMGSFLKVYAKTPNIYAELYYTYKERFQQKHPDWTLMHCHLAALLKAAKIFVSHLWEISRQVHGLPYREPYPVEYLGHVTKLPPSLALHPRKARSEVIAAIQSVWHLLQSEEDEDVRKLHETLLTRFEERLNGKA